MICSAWRVHSCIVLIIALALVSNAATVRLPSPPMGWSSWESFAKNVSEDAIMQHLKILTDSGLRDKGYNIIQIDDGWMKMDRQTGWISRQNYDTIPSNSLGPGGRPGFFSDLSPGCMIPDPTRFPNGMLQLGQSLKSKGFKFGLYTSGEHFVCDSQRNFKGFYTSSSYSNLREIDAECFTNWNVDLLKIDMCNPPNRKDNYASSVIRAWREILPDNMIIYNSRYNCLAKVRCTKRPSGIYRCPMAINFAANKNVLSYCPASSDLARLGQDMKPDWQHIIAGLLSRVGRGKVSKPGFWSDPDYLIPHATKVSFIEARSQFSAWCITSSPLFVSVDLTEASPQTLEMLGNVDAIRVNQQYFNDGGDRWYMKGVIWTFTKRLSADETALLILNVGKQFARGRGPRKNGDVVARIDSLAKFHPTNRKAKQCSMKNIWTGESGLLLPKTSFVIGSRDCVFLLIKDCVN